VTSRRRRDEAGAYLILYALLAVAFFTMAAVVLDIAALRQGRRADRTTADLAATAAVAGLDVRTPSTFSRACADAWGYVLANRTEARGTITAPPCTTTFPSSDACNDFTAARTATGTIGTITISITHPVPDTSPLMRAETQGGDLTQPVSSASDGRACERVAVRIVRTRNFLFGQIAGATGGTTDVHSVARALTATSTTEVPAVVAVDPTACQALSTDPGAGSLQLGSAATAGVAIVDSDASGCGAGSFAISAGATGDPAGRLVALTAGSTPGQIRSSALAGGSFAFAYDPGAVGDGRLAPQPSPALVRTGRGIVDDRYKCSTCPGGSNVIDPLVAARSSGVPPGATVYGGPCTIGPSMGGQISAPSLYVDCDDLVIDTSVTFLGTSVTVKGNVTVTSGGCLAVNDAGCGASGIVAQDADLYVRGSLSKDVKGQVLLPRTFVYLGGNVTIGVDEDPTLGNSALLWSAPLAGPYEDLLAWSESSSPMLLGEQKATALTGTFVAPNAPLTLNPRGGGGVSTPLQAVVRTLRLTGNGTYRLQPTADRATGSFTRQVRLIR
jgi:hypothetical protein